MLGEECLDRLRARSCACSRVEESLWREREERVLYIGGQWRTERAAEQIRLETHRYDATTGVGINRRQRRSAEPKFLKRGTRISQLRARRKLADRLEDVSWYRLIPARSEAR